MGMPARCEATLCFETSKLAGIAALWHENADENGLPPRRAFNAHTLKNVLPNVIIADRVQEDGRHRYRFRVIGTTISELLGELTGKVLDEAVVSPFRERWSAVLESANQAGSSLRIFGRLEYRKQDYIAMEMMVAPLGTHVGHADAVLVIAQPSYSSRHLFHPLVKDKVAAQGASAQRA
ncbi:MAG TPA: PAS domain-containing protein [Rhizomicrobium sp.]